MGALDSEQGLRTGQFGSAGLCCGETVGARLRPLLPNVDQDHGPSEGSTGTGYRSEQPEYRRA